MLKIKFLGQFFHSATFDESIGTITTGIKTGSNITHSVINVAKLVKMSSDVELKKYVEACDIINVDGSGIIFGARILGVKIPERVTGIDLFSKLLGVAATNKFPIFLLGSTDSRLQRAVRNIKLKYPQIIIAGTNDGFFHGNEEKVVNKIKKSNAKLVFVAMPTPLKEKFIYDWSKEIGANFIMGIGGTLDIISGDVKRAPKLFQNAGLEWFFRLCCEPRRLFWRYFHTNSLFALMIIKALFTRDK